MSKRTAVIFDVDGVLLDSLEPHLQICRDKNHEYDLELAIPSIAEFKKQIRHGVQISPMKYFFKAVGFSEVFAEKADQYYQAHFGEEYPVKPFEGIDHLLTSLKQSYQLGIVTSNNLENIQNGLGELMEHFDPSLIYTEEPGIKTSKKEALSEIIQLPEISKERTIYVGDQPKDAIAAKAVGLPFIAVSYGWGFEENTTSYPVAKSPASLPEVIKALRIAP